MNIEKWFEEVRELGWKPGLTRVKELLRRFDNPQNKLDIIHISGTNGKGSTATLLANILTEGGFKTGQFSTPAILGFNHMFLIDQEAIHNIKLFDIVARVQGVIDDMLSDGFEHPTEYEIIATIMYIYFYEEHVDFAVVEVAMGGEKDCTNVMDYSILSIMTPISLDHASFLGDTLRDIASEKSGIIKENSVLITHPQEEEVMAVLKEVCHRRNSAIRFFDHALDITYDHLEMHFEYAGMTIQSKLLGQHQARNIIHVIEAIRDLNIRGYTHIRGKMIEDSIRRTVFPGRFESIGDFILDGAHNNASLLALRDTLEVLNLKDLTGIIGVLRDKDIEMGLRALKPYFKSIYVTEAKSDRRLEMSKLKDILLDLDYPVKGMDTVENLMALDLKNVLAFGSFYMISEVRKIKLLKDKKLLEQ